MTNVNLRNVGKSAKRVALWFEWVSYFMDHLKIRDFKKNKLASYLSRLLPLVSLKHKETRFCSEFFIVL